MAELEDGKGNKEEAKKKKRKQGGLRTAPFILANEVCDRFAAAGFHANMISYLTLQLHMPMVQASNTLTNFGGTSNLTPIIGGLIADSFAGRFWTITVGSLIYQLGMISLTVSAVLPAFRPPPCHLALSGTNKQPHPPPPCQRASPWQLCVLYLSLLVTAVGSGGIRPCVMAFGADQFDLGALRRDRTKKQQRWSFFNLYYFSMGVALLMALTVVVYVQDNVGWGWGLGIPTIAMAVSVVVFVAGFPLYIRMKPAGSPLTRLAQVVVAAFRKRNVAVPKDPGMLHQDSALDAVLSVRGKLVHTHQLRFFDRAAVVTEADGFTKPAADLWRLSTVHRVEELKSVLRMLPIWVVGITSVMATSHNHSFAVQQARSMDRHLTPSFQVPPASMNVFTVATMLLTLTLYDRLFVPLARRVTGHPAGISCLQRMGVGFAITTFANVAAALVEAKRKAAAARSGLLDTPAAVVPISVFWLVPQYAVHGLAETFSSVGHLEFLYDQAPESMRSTAVALSWLANSIGNYLGTFLVTQVQRCTRNASTGGWLQDNINRGNLDRYYWLVVALQLINLVYYLLCAKFYTYKPLEVEVAAVAPKVADDGGVIDMETADARHTDAVSKDCREEEPRKESGSAAAV